jgi:D-alanyl-D-alanine carboxypeptidase
MPWLARFRRGAGIPTVFLTLSMGVVVSCVSITTTAQVPATTPEANTATAALPEPGATASPEATAAAAAPKATLQTVSSPVPTPVAAAHAVPTPTPAATPTLTPTLPPSLAPTGVPSLEPTATPTAMPTEAPEPTTLLATANAPELDKATRRKLGTILANTVENKNVAGLQAAVRLPSGETWLGTAGNADFLPDRAIEDDTSMAIASITKTFIAALILQLAEEGAIDLDVPFGTYFSDAPRSKTATIRQLLSHTSGIYNYFENPRYYKAASAWLQSSPSGLNSREHRWTYDEIMDLVKTGYCKPGKCYHYSNTNFVILGQIAEAVGGKPLHKQLRQRFFNPLGMQDTIFQPEERPPADAAHGHWFWGAGYSDHTRDSRFVPFMAAASVADAAGAIASTASDLSIWADALYGGKVLTDESLEEMTTFFSSGLYGLGADVASFAGNRGHGHRGGLRGFESSMWYFPADGVSIVLLSNQGNWITDVPMEKLVRAVLGKA